MRSERLPVLHQSYLGQTTFSWGFSLKTRDTRGGSLICEKFNLPSVSYLSNRLETPALDVVDRAVRPPAAFPAPVRAIRPRVADGEAYRILLTGRQQGYAARARLLCLVNDIIHCAK